jgi:RHS repeat-associated protein
MATQGSSTQPFGFTGEQRDGETGLVYLRARMYDPQTGRFLQRDWLAKSAPGISGWNRYAYAANNPVNLTDPGGLDPLGVFAHQMIENEFVRRNPTFKGEVSHPELGIRIDLEEVLPEPTGVFYEIKHWTQRAEGVEQVAQRTALDFIPGGPREDMWINAWLPGLVLHSWHDSDRGGQGLILYEWTFEPPDAIPFPFPFPGRKPSRLPKSFPAPRPVPQPGVVLPDPLEAD